MQGKILNWGIAIWLLLVTTSAMADVPGVTFTVAKHASITDLEYDAAYFDEKMEDATDRVNLYDTHCYGTAMDDLPCAILFERDGALSTFGSNGDGLETIDTAAEENAVFNVNADVIVVDDIRRCGNLTGGSIIGCGNLNRRRFIVERDVPADVYVHEYGHNMGLLDQDDGCTYAIMHATSDITDTLTSDQCTAMRGHPFEVLPHDASDRGAGPLTYDTGPYWADTDITIPAGQTLTVQSGTEIQFEPGVSIRGRLIADGRTGAIRLYSNCSQKYECPRPYE